VFACFLAVAITGCKGAGEFLRELLRERPPAALDSIPLASDARIDSAGYLAGSFVGEGTSRAIHLLSSDSAFIGDLMRRFRPDLAGGADPWAALERAGFVALGPQGGRRAVGGSPRIQSAVVGSPLGHTGVQVEAVLLHGGRRGCGARGAQAEHHLPHHVVGAAPVAADVEGAQAGNRGGRGGQAHPGLFTSPGF